MSLCGVCELTLCRRPGTRAEAFLAADTQEHDEPVTLLQNALQALLQQPLPSIIGGVSPSPLPWATPALVMAIASFLETASEQSELDERGVTTPARRLQDVCYRSLCVLLDSTSAAARGGRRLAQLLALPALSCPGSAAALGACGGGSAGSAVSGLRGVELLRSALAPDMSLGDDEPSVSLDVVHACVQTVRLCRNGCCPPANCASVFFVCRELLI